jgi:hypothetical protein
LAGSAQFLSNPAGRVFSRAGWLPVRRDESKSARRVSPDAGTTEPKSEKRASPAELYAKLPVKETVGIKPDEGKAGPHKQRHVVENFFCRIKAFSGVWPRAL